jgi:PIN domain nuclease of toxin-antitoxin system
VQNLPPLHGDPFDRVLMAQAQVEGLTLMSNDGVLKDYGVSLIW